MISYLKNNFVQFRLNIYELHWVVFFELSRAAFSHSSLLIVRFFDCRLQWIGKSFSESVVGRISVDHLFFISAVWQLRGRAPDSRWFTDSRKTVKHRFLIFREENMKDGNELYEREIFQKLGHSLFLYST